MPCDRKLRAGQTVTARASEIRKVVETIVSGLVNGRVKPKIGPTGGIAFQGLTEDERAGVDDVCAYRRVMATGSALAKAAIAKAEALSGRTVNRQALAHGHHAHADHNGNLHWHDHK